MKFGAARPVGSTSALRTPRLDVPLLASAVLLMFFGLSALYSVDKSLQGGFFEKQLVMLALGLIPLSIFYLVPLGFLRKASNWLYAMNLLLLVMVVAIGAERGGAQRWIEVGGFQFQPSEVAKLLAILTLASFFASRTQEVRSIRTFLLSLLHIAPITALVFIQPHLGSAVGMLAIWFVICLYAGVPTKFLAISGLAAVLLAGIAFHVPGLMQPYQRERVIGLVSPDPADTGYQQRRAMIAIGVGGVLGTGFLQGEEKAAHFIPEQQTDFIFSVIAEEGGLVGSTLLLAAFGFLFYRIWLIGYLASTPYPRMVAGGVLAILAYHTIVNLGMNLAITPVVGLWLPFISYGGTALWLCMAFLGLLMNLSTRESEQWFESPQGPG